LNQEFTEPPDTIKLQNIYHQTGDTNLVPLLPLFKVKLVCFEKIQYFDKKKIFLLTNETIVLTPIVSNLKSFFF